MVKKKKKGGYCLSSGKWNIDASASKSEKDAALKSFLELENATTVEEKKVKVEQARIFIQKHLRELEPGQALEDLKMFWLAGPDILSEWFEWLCGGSKLGSLALSVSQQKTKVLNIVKKFLVSKKGDEFERDIKESEDASEEDTGSDIMHQVFLLRQLIFFFRNQATKLIFIDGTDGILDGPGGADPNILIIKQNTFGVEEFDVKVMINLRIGDKTVFSDLTFSQALAGVVQLYFCFNLLYPPELDDTLQFLERIVCCFGSQDGARNKMNGIRKGFREFEVIYFKLDLRVLTSFLFRDLLQRFCWNLTRGRLWPSSTDVV